MSHESQDLEELLDHLRQAEHGDRVSFGAMLDAAGRRSFGPLLLVPGLLVLSPLGGIPGMATSAGLVSLLVSVQLLLRRRSFWLPQWLLSRSVPYGRFLRALDALRRPARWVDKPLRPRLHGMLQAPALQLVALGCIAVGTVMPLLEVVPFADTAPGAALSALGLGLIAHDGLLVLIAALLLMLTAGIAAAALLG